MNIEEATEELLDLVYDPPIFHSDPYVQRKSVETSIADILGDLEIEPPSRFCDECASFKREVIDLQEDKEDLQDQIARLKQRLVELEGE